MSNKLPRSLCLQPNIYINDNKEVIYEKFEESHSGIIKSMTTIYQDDVEDVYEIWNKYKANFKLQK